MSLDQNLFTLNVVPKGTNELELVEPSGTVHYRKERVLGTVYTVNLFDPLSESLLVTATAPSATSKHKTIQLHNPSVTVEFKYTGTLTFRWGFRWEQHDFEWKKDECYMLRKPDPPVLVAICKEASTRNNRPAAIQILDYNLHRFDIEDRKGLEIVILATMLTFQDSADEYASKKDDPKASGSQAPSRTNTSPTSPSVNPVEDIPPEIPPKPVKTGIERIAEMQKGELNEVLVEGEGDPQEYAQYCSNLLEGDNMLFIEISSSSATMVPKVLQVVEQVKRIRHLTGEDDNLQQYVQYDAPAFRASKVGSTSGRKGPRIIKLDDEETKPKGKKSEYKPPDSIVVYLSKIPMPELQPKVNLNTKPSLPGDSSKNDKKSKSPERSGVFSGNKKDKKLAKSSPPSPPSSSLGFNPEKLFKSSSYHARANEVHPHQPSPSPSQLNNPMIYSAPSVPPPPPTVPPRPNLSFNAGSSSGMLRRIFS